MRHLKLMADYGCYPIWRQDGNGDNNVDPANLPISKELCEDLDAWADKFDGTLNHYDPEASGFESLETEQAFKAEALVLLERLKKELGDRYTLILQL